MSEITHLQGTVGPLDEAGVAAGQSHAVRTGKAGGFLNTPVSASFQEAVLRGRCFTATNQVGVITQAGLSATTPVLTLANPTGSGVNGVLWYAGVTFDIAFTAATPVWLAAGTDTTDTAVTGTATSAHRNCLLGGSNNPKVNVFLAATLPAAPVAINMLGMGLEGAISVQAVVPTLERWFNGSIVLGENTNVSIQSLLACGTAGAFCEYIWEEVPITV